MPDKSSENNALTEFAEFAERWRNTFEPIAKPARELRQKIKPLLDAAKPARELGAKFALLNLSNRSNSTYQRTTCSVGGKSILPVEQTPQITKSKPRPTTIDKQTEIREAYAKAQRKLGRFAQVSKIIDEVIKETGSSRRNIYRALEGEN